MRKRIALLGILTLLASGGCGDSSGPGGEAVGTWNLLTVNGRQVPTVVVSTGVEIQSSTISIRPDGSFTDVFVLRPTWTNTATTFEEPGTWVRDDRQITLTYASNGSSGNGTVADNVLTMDFDGAWVFVRE
jgi:hypothetical protein